VLDSGVRRVLIGHRDPNPAVCGRGLRRLRRRGLHVEEEVLGDACRYQHRGFVCVQERGRPWVALKLASSLDGRIGTRSGESRWITGPQARARVHRLRDAADGVMVGSGTARSDDPALTVRRGDVTRRCPVRILVDSGLRVPARARLFRDAYASRTWVLASRAAAQRHGGMRGASGARVLQVARRGKHLDLARALQRLAREGLTTLLVEGGGGLAAALLRAGRVDEVHWFVAPSLIGGEGRPALAGLGLRRLAERVDLEIERVGRLGKDLYVHGLVKGTKEPRA